LFYREKEKIEKDAIPFNKVESRTKTWKVISEMTNEFHALMQSADKGRHTGKGNQAERIPFEQHGIRIDLIRTEFE
jgi:hypothetical protein